MKNLLYSFIGLSFILISQAFAQSTNFEPVEGYFSSYSHSHKFNSKIRNILLKDADDSPRAMLVTLPGYNRQNAIVLSSNEVTIITLNDVYISAKSSEKNISAKHQSFEISEELADVIHQLWFNALKTVAYSDERQTGRDGINYYFTSFKVGLGLRAGKAWSPKKKSLPYELIQIADDLIKLKTKEDEKVLLKRIKELNLRSLVKPTVTLHSSH